MPLTRNEKQTLSAIEKDAKKLAKEALKLGRKARNRLIREMKKS